MTSDRRSLLETLRAELEFLQKGGYRKSSWRPQFIFEDSPTCLNYNDPEHSKPCTDCVLMKMVPAEIRNEPFPCRHIPLNDEGETIDSLYRSATQEEIEATVALWLKETIKKMESEQAKYEKQEHKAAKGSR